MGMHSIQVTNTGAATRFSTTSVRIREIYCENNAGNVMRVAGSTVSASVGVSLTASGVPASVLHLGPTPGLNMDLQDFYVFGTANDKLDVLYVT